MLRFSKIVFLVCSVAFLIVPSAAHSGPPEIMLIDSLNPTMPVLITGNGENVSVNNFTIGRFIVTLKGHANEANNTNGVLELTANITGGGPTETLTILLTDTDYRQNGRAIFAESVTGTITGPGLVTFAAFLDLNDKPFVTTTGTNHLLLLGPYGDPDAPISGSDSTMVTDTTTYSMTSQTMVTGGDVSFTFTVTNNTSSN